MVEVLSAGSDRIDLYFSEKHHSNMENGCYKSQKCKKIMPSSLIAGENFNYVETFVNIQTVLTNNRQSIF